MSDPTPETLVADPTQVDVILSEDDVAEASFLDDGPQNVVKAAK